MFNLLFSSYKLFFIALFSFCAILAIRRLVFKRPVPIFLYQAILFCTLFIAAVGGGGVQNTGYDQLHKFIELEQNNQFEQARKAPENYDPMLQGYLLQFNNSSELKDYLQKYDSQVDIAEVVFSAWILVILADIAIGLKIITRRKFTINQNKITVT